MPSPNEDALLLRFCSALHTSADTVELIQLVADNADFVRVCRHLAAPPNAAYEQRIQSLCQKHGINAEKVRQRALRISRALKINAPTGTWPDYYATLGVPATADAKSIKHAFRQKAKTLHPDKQVQSNEAFLKLQEAYEMLSNARLRNHYDRIYCNRARWSEPKANPHPPKRYGAYWRQFAFVCILMVLLAAAAFVFELFYNETSLFSGAGPVAEPDQDITSTENKVSGHDTGAGPARRAVADAPAKTETKPAPAGIRPVLNDDNFTNATIH